MGLGARIGMALVGLAIVSIYSVAAFATFLFALWLVANPPDPGLVLLAIAIGVLGAGVIGYRLGTMQLLASLESHPLPRGRAPELHRRLDRLVDGMALTRPALMVANLGAANALSIGGPRTGAIVVDRRLIRLLTVDELEAILAHELAHLESHDALINTLALTAVRTLAGLVALAFVPFLLLLAGVERSAGWFAGRPGYRIGLADLFRATIFLGIALLLSVLTLGFLAYAREREFAADRRAAELTGNPAALARALVKIDRANRPRRGLLRLLYTHEHRHEDEHRLLSTHPPLEERIDRLLDRVDRPIKNHYVTRLRPP